MELTGRSISAVEQVVDRDVEDLGELGHEVGGDVAAPGLVVRDHSLRGADGVGQLDLREAALFAELTEPLGESGGGGFLRLLPTT